MIVKITIFFVFIFSVTCNAVNFYPGFMDLPIDQDGRQLSLRFDTVFDKKAEKLRLLDTENKFFRLFYMEYGLSKFTSVFFMGTNKNNEVSFGFSKTIPYFYRLKQKLKFEYYSRKIFNKKQNNFFVTHAIQYYQPFTSFSPFLNLYFNNIDKKFLAAFGLEYKPFVFAGIDYEYFISIDNTRDDIYVYSLNLQFPHSMYAKIRLSNTKELMVKNMIYGTTTSDQFLSICLEKRFDFSWTYRKINTTHQKDYLRYIQEADDSV